jgi:GntR family transcriptional regulator
MLIQIDPLSPVPLYQQLRDRVVEAIAAAELHPGDQLASVRQVAEQFGINTATVAKGYELLKQEGLVRTHRRSGSVVARGPASAAPSPGFAADWTARLRTLLAEAVAQGLPPADIQQIAARTLDQFSHPEGMPS